MAHHDQRARPVVAEVLELAQGVQVQVVRGLVEQQHVRSLRQGQQELEPAPLPTRQQADRRPLCVAVEPEGLHQRGVGPVGVAVTPRHGVTHPLVRVQLAAGLVVVAESDRRADLDAPGGGGQPPRDDVEQRRLAGAVRTHDAQALPVVQQQLDVAEQLPAVAVAVTDVAQLDHPVAQPGCAGVQWEVPGTCCRRRPTIDDRPRGLQSGLGLRGARRGTTTQPGELGAGQVPTAVLGLRRVLLPTAATLEVGAVAALVDVAVTAVELEHPSGDAIQEVAVVGDQDQAAAVLGEAVLEPGDRVDVQVVGRLVQDEQVGLGHQRPGQRDPLGLSAREAFDGLVHHRAQAQAVRHRGRLPLALVVPLDDGLAHGRAGEARVLFEHGDAHVATAPDGAVLGQIDPGDDAQQRRLAAAVEPHDAEAVRIRDREGHVREQRTSRSARCHTVDVEEDHPVTLGAGPISR